MTSPFVKYSRIYSKVNRLVNCVYYLSGKYQKRNYSMADGLTDATKTGLALTAGLAVYKAFFAPKAGAVPDPNAKDASVTWAGAEDFRCRIKVPESYITGYTSGYGGALTALGGIIFPYTPSISFDNSANYSNQSPMHSNYTYYSYRNSQVGAISVSGRFSVENNKDAMTYLATVHLLRSLTKMKFGIDADAGAPPPVCRLFAYGNYMLNNIPVVVSNFKQEFPTDVDYYKLDNSWQYGQNTFIPIMSTLSVTLLPMYSRAEQATFGVDSYLGSDDLRKKGFL
jgi:hypothetical protein